MATSTISNKTPIDGTVSTLRTELNTLYRDFAVWSTKDLTPLNRKVFTITMRDAPYVTCDFMAFTRYGVIVGNIRNDGNGNITSANVAKLVGSATTDSYTITYSGHVATITGSTGWDNFIVMVMAPSGTEYSKSYTVEFPA